MTSMLVSPPTAFLDAATTSPSKKRRRSIEPADSDAKILTLAPLVSVSVAVAGTATATPTVAEQDAFAAADAADAAGAEASEILGRSLMGLSLQLKLKMILMEAWASDMNSVVMERCLFNIAKELAILNEMGVYEPDTCVRFLQLARSRMVQLLAQSERRETMQMEAAAMWTMAQMQAQETMRASDPTDTSEFPLLSGYDAASRDLAVLWKAMLLAKERGAQLWHENKPEEALPFLVAADSYMKRFTLKYQRLKIDHAMLDTFQSFTTASSPTASSPKRKTAHRVSFVDEPEVLGVADSNVDRSPINPSKPSKLESLLLRTSREFPTPRF